VGASVVADRLRSGLHLLFRHTRIDPLDHARLGFPDDSVDPLKFLRRTAEEDGARSQKYTVPVAVPMQP